MEVDPGEAIGRAISHSGLFDISAVETVFRLVGAGETVLDVGANIGFMTAAALSAQRTANVIAFEPHPALFARLSTNHALWVRQRPDVSGRLILEQVAVSDTAGTANLYVSRDFTGNQGIASLEAAGQEADRMMVSVRTVTLDEYVGVQRQIGVMKLDIEGHEFAVLSGARRLLESGRIRDILYEDHAGFHSNVYALLSSLGYTIFFVAKLPWGMWLCDRPSEMDRARALSFDSPNFLATLDPVRVRRLMAGFGYRCVAG